MAPSVSSCLVGKMKKLCIQAFPFKSSTGNYVEFLDDTDNTDVNQTPGDMEPTGRKRGNSEEYLLSKWLWPRLERVSVGFEANFLVREFHL